MRNFIFSIVVLVLSLFSSYSDAYQGKRVYNFWLNCKTVIGTSLTFQADTANGSLGGSRFAPGSADSFICELPNDYTADNTSLNWQWHQDNIESVSFTYYNNFAPTPGTIYVAVCESKNDLSLVECGTWKYITGTYGTITLYRTSDFPDLTNSHGAPFLAVRSYGADYLFVMYLSTYIVNKTL